MDYLCEHGIYYREPRDSADIDLGEECVTVVGVHEGKIVSERMIAVLSDRR